MILANTTFFIAPGRSGSFRTWVRGKYIPALIEAGFTSPLLLRILGNDDPGVVSFAVQAVAPSAEAARAWLIEGEGEGERLRSGFAADFREECLWFVTLMEQI